MENDLLKSFGFVTVDENILQEEEKRSRTGLSSAEDITLSAKRRKEKATEKAAFEESVRSAVRNRTILMNSIGSVQTYTVHGQSFVCACILIKDDYKFIIPFSEMFQNDPILLEAERYKEPVDFSTEKGKNILHKRQREILEAMLDSTVRFLPTEVIDYGEDRGFIVVASRKKVLDLDRYTYFLSPDAVIGKTDVPRFAKVVFARKAHALVCFGGEEKLISGKKMTNRYYEKLDHIFRAGQEVCIVIRNLSVEDGKVSCMFDRITGEILENRDKLKKVAKNELLAVTVSKTLEHRDADGNRKRSLIGWADTYGLPVRINSMPYERRVLDVHIGDKCSACVTGVDKDGYVSCYIRHIIDYMGV